MNLGPRPDRLQIVAIERDIQRTPAKWTPKLRFDQRRQPIRELNTTSLDADEHQLAATGRLHDKLRRHARKYPPHGGGVEKAGR